MSMSLLSEARGLRASGTVREGEAGEAARREEEAAEEEARRFRREVTDVLKEAEKARREASGLIPVTGTAGGGEATVSPEKLTEAVTAVMAGRAKDQRKADAARQIRNLERFNKSNVESLAKALNLPAKQMEAGLKVLDGELPAIQAVLEAEIDNEEYGKRMKEIDERINESFRRAIEFEKLSAHDRKKVPPSFLGGMLSRTGNR
jgi:hypothetical protein